jgi:hypothetical protein
MAQEESERSLVGIGSAGRRDDETTARVSVTEDLETFSSLSAVQEENLLPSAQPAPPPKLAESAYLQPPATVSEPLEPAYIVDDDDDDEFDFEEPFDLASLLLERRPSSENLPKESYLAAHIVRMVGGHGKETVCVKPGSPFKSATGDLVCRMGGGGLSINPSGELDGSLVINGQQVAIATALQSGVSKFVLKEGDSARLSGSMGAYSIEVYRPPLAPVTRGFKPDPRFLWAIGIAFVIHIVVSVAVAVVQPRVKAKDANAEKETFAMVKMDKPEEPKQEELAVHEEAPQNAQQIAERAPPKVTAKTIRRRIKEREKSKSSGGGGSVSSLLQVLGRGSGKPGASNKLKDLVSNIDAVASSKAGGSAFSIAGAIASLPGDGVNIARKGGGGAISTLSGEQVAGKGTGVGTLARGARSGKVRGKVTKMSSGAKVKGSLSMAEVSRVVNSHTHALQACYERALMGNPSLSGRIAFDWTVQTSGRVKGVRVRSSTLGSPQVASCISNLIKKWKFPRPKGGEVVITYPFLFRGVH